MLLGQEWGRSTSWRGWRREDGDEAEEGDDGYSEG
jgi:hypothetical protein